MRVVSPLRFGSFVLSALFFLSACNSAHPNAGAATVASAEESAAAQPESTTEAKDVFASAENNSSAWPSASPVAMNADVAQSAGATPNAVITAAAASPNNCPFALNPPLTACRVVGPSNYYLTMSTAQGSRGFLVYVPPTIAGPVPVVLNYHAYSANAFSQQAGSGLLPFAKSLGFLLVSPDGVGNSWNAGACCGIAKANNIDDVAFTKSIIRVLQSYGIVNSQRIYAVGLSNGGMMAQRIACALSTVIAAVGTIVGPNGQFPNGVVSAQGQAYACNPARAVPIFMAYGQRDPIVPYGGGAVVLNGQKLFNAISASANFTYWAQVNHCSNPNAVAQVGQMGSAIGFRNSSSCGAPVFGVVVTNGGHEWFPEFPLPQVLVQFFAENPL